MAESPQDRTAIYPIHDYLASGMIAVQLAISADEGLARLRAYAYANARPINAVAADIIAHRLRMHDHRQI